MLTVFIQLAFTEHQLCVRCQIYKDERDADALGKSEEAGVTNNYNTLGCLFGYRSTPKGMKYKRRVKLYLSGLTVGEELLQEPRSLPKAVDF